jgi:GATA-binding protein
MDIPFAMPVVSLTLSDSRFADRNEGLYHKLHGAHRPVAMKKSIIKRRKRVLPALRDSSNQQSPDTSFLSMTESEQQPHDDLSPNDPEQRNLGLAVDFTGYSGGPYPPPSRSRPQDPTKSPQRKSRSHRKRSFSRTNGDIQEANPGPGSGRLASIRSILNPSQLDNSDVHIEPSLLAMGRPRPDAEPRSSTPSKRAELEREAARMREMLAAKEQELAMLDQEEPAAASS